MMAKFLITTYNQEGQESKKPEHEPFNVEAETILDAAQAIEGGELLVVARFFILVGVTDGAKVLRFVVSPVLSK